MDEDIFFILPKDTQATVIEKKEYPSVNMTRYKIDFTSTKGKMTGWIHAWDVKS